MTAKDQPVYELIDKFRGALQDYNTNITVYGMYESRAFRYFAEAMQQLIKAECTKAMEKGIRLERSRNLVQVGQLEQELNEYRNSWRTLQQLLKGEK